MTSVVGISVEDAVGSRIVPCYVHSIGTGFVKGCLDIFVSSASELNSPESRNN
jgi:hypothetical protein